MFSLLIYLLIYTSSNGAPNATSRSEAELVVELSDLVSLSVFFFIVTSLCYSHFYTLGLAILIMRSYTKLYLHETLVNSVKKQ